MEIKVGRVYKHKNTGEMARLLKYDRGAKAGSLNITLKKTESATIKHLKEYEFQTQWIEYRDENELRLTFTPQEVAKLREVWGIGSNISPQEIKNRIINKR